jgi:hypothetical protein
MREEGRMSGGWVRREDSAQAMRCGPDLGPRAAANVHLFGGARIFVPTAGTANPPGRSERDRKTARSVHLAAPECHWQCTDALGHPAVPITGRCARGLGLRGARIQGGKTSGSRQRRGTADAPRHRGAAQFPRVGEACWGQLSAFWDILGLFNRDIRVRVLRAPGDARWRRRSGEPHSPSPVPSLPLLQ